MSLLNLWISRTQESAHEPLCPVSLQASRGRMTHQGRNSPEHSGDALQVGKPWGSLWVRGQKEEGLGSSPRKGQARGLCSSLSSVSVPTPRTRRRRGSQQLSGSPSGGRNQSPHWAVTHSHSHQSLSQPESLTVTLTLVTLPARVTHSHSESLTVTHSHSLSHSHSHTGPPHSHPLDPAFHHPASSPVSL